MEAIYKVSVCYMFNFYFLNYEYYRRNQKRTY